MDDDDVRGWLRAHLRVHANDVQQQFGAHAIGIGDAEGGGPTLRVYVAPSDAAAASGAERPGTFTFSVPGQIGEVAVPVEIVETPPAELE